MCEGFDPLDSALLALQAAADGGCAEQGLRRLRQQRLAGLLRACQARSPLYRRWLQGVDPSRARLQDLPVARRSVLMEHFDEWVADPRLRLRELRDFVADPLRIAEPYAGRYLVWHSSGTSGEPGMFVQDAHAMAVYDALECVRGPWARLAPELAASCNLQRKLVLVGATEEHFASTVAAARLRRLNPWLATQLRSLSLLQPPAELRRAIERLQPVVLATFPSVALQLAEERAAGRLDVALREVWVGGETLSPATRRFIERSFGCPVRNSYGASEFLSIASPCVHGAMHLNADWVILEPLDEHGRAADAGSEGSSVLLTNLANHVQPLLRYQMSDRISLSPQRCACGSALPVITVQGRDDDVLHLPARGGGVLAVSPLAITTIVEERAGLLDYQVVQTAADRLVLGCRGRDTSTRRRLARAVRQLQSWLDSLGVADVRVRGDAELAIELAAGGKVPRVLALRAARRVGATAAGA